jgi:hypothetical protein
MSGQEAFERFTDNRRTRPPNITFAGRQFTQMVFNGDPDFYHARDELSKSNNFDDLAKTMANGWNNPFRRNTYDEDTNYRYLTFVYHAASVGLGSKPTFAAFAHEINVKSEGERRLCGQSRTWPKVLSGYRMTRLLKGFAIPQRPLI